MSASALFMKNRTGKIGTEMNQKNSINFMSSHLWPLTPSQLHGLAVIQVT